MIVEAVVSAMGDDVTYDLAVVGLGVIGAAALAHATRLGLHAVGIDSFTPPHDKGSSHGQTRLLRVAYAEGTVYVPFVRRAIALWGEIEQQTNRTLFHRTGVLYAGPPGCGLIAGVRDAAAQSGIEIETCTAVARAARFAQFHIPPEWDCVLEPGAGFLRAEESVSAFLDVARKSGAHVIPSRTVHGLSQNGDVYRITTDGPSISAAHILVCCGPWSAGLLPFLRPVVRIRRKTLHWHSDPRGLHTIENGFLPFAFDDGAGNWHYGTPALGGAVKLAVHSPHEGGATVRSPADVDRRIGPDDMETVDFAARVLPGLGPVTHSTVCLYTMSPDEHFIIDRHPDFSGVAFAAGLSGHGFKFAPAIAEMLCNIVLGRSQNVSIQPFSLTRFK